MHTINISMNALVSHPDIIRWILWSWKNESKWYRSVYNLFDMILNKPIDICITNSTLTIFENEPIDISSCPTIVKNIYFELKTKKEIYFDSINTNNVFRNFNYNKCKLNVILEQKIDRLGWITWCIWWFLKSQPTRFFLMKDIITTPLINIKRKHKSYCTECLPLPPWIKKRPNDIKTIYTSLQQTIYYECLN